MKKIAIILTSIYLTLNLSYAQDFGCSRNNEAGKMYLGNKKVNLTNNSDSLKCKNWLDKIEINTLDGDDIIYSLKSDHSGSTLNLGNGNDIIDHTFDDGVLANIIIDGGNGYDILKINKQKEVLVVSGECSKECKIYIKDEWNNPHWKLKNVTLKKIEEIQLTDGNIKFDNNGNSENEQNDSNIDNNSNTNNNQTNYHKIDLSSYKYMIPAYWWNDDLNKKLIDFDNKSVIAIVNPSNGDFSKSEEIFQDMIKNIHNKQNLAIGYIHSGYGKRNLGDIKKAIDNWLQYYPNIEGIFIDETSNKVSDYDFYKEIFNYIKTKNSNLTVVLNTGINAPEKFINISDNLIIYENPCSDYGNYSLDSWVNKYSKHNFTFLGYSCSKSQYNNLSNKYKNYINYFTDDGSDGNPWDSLSKYLYKNNNSSDNSDTENINEYIPYELNKFQNSLKQSKLTYPDSHTKVVDKGQFENYKSNTFYANENDNLVFVLKKESNNGKIRNELRQQQANRDSGWQINEKTIHILKSKIKLQKLNEADEYTFLQIHSEKYPLLRIVVKKDKNGLQNHIWAVIRKNTNSSGNTSDRYDLGLVSDNFEDFKIEVGNNNLKIYINKELKIDKNISYWTEVKNYFKAGIYDSKNSQAPFEIKIIFKEFKMVEKTTDNSDNNQPNNQEVYIPSINVFEISPYTDVSLYPFEELSKVYDKTNHKDYTLAFIVGEKNKCTASWGGYYNIENGPDAWINGNQKYLYDEVKYVQNKGGKITISFGGADGTPLFENCDNSDLLFNEYQKVINKVKPSEIDFDIEGSHLNKIDDFEKLFKTLKKINTTYPNIKIWFTLPVMPEGLENNAINFISLMLKSGVKFSGINIMTMDYASSYNLDMGDYAVSATKNTAKQIQEIYKKSGKDINIKNIYNILGITSMIGVNDISIENFTLKNSKKIKDFSIQNNIGKISYWSLNRDHPCSGDKTKDKCSSKNNQKNDYEYLITFKEDTTTDNNHIGTGNNDNIDTNTNLGTLIGEYPKQKWATKFIDKNNNGKNDLIAEINPWNIKSADGYAKMYYNEKTKVISYKQDLSNIKQIDKNGYVLAYPEIYIGNKPWNGNYVDAGSKLPEKVKNLKSLIVNAKWSYIHTDNLSTNFAMEGWFTKKEFEKTKVGNNEVEMMIMWYRNIQGAAGSKIKQVTIPVEVNGVNKNITFDIYKTNIGWDFITFIPHNYQDFKNVEVKFDIVNFTNETKKILSNLDNLYLEDWEFGTEYGTPNTNEAKLSWNIYKYDINGILKKNNSNNIQNTTTTTNKILRKLDNKINILFEKIKKGSTKNKYRKNLILLMGKINKIKKKYSDNDLILILIDYINEKVSSEILKTNLEIKNMSK